MSLFCFGLSHHTAPLDVRERFTIPHVALPGALARLKIMPGLNEGLILSTCNPTEFYVPGELRKWSSAVFSKTSAPARATFHGPFSHASGISTRPLRNWTTFICTVSIRSR